MLMYAVPKRERPITPKPGAPLTTAYDKSIGEGISRWESDRLLGNGESSNTRASRFFLCMEHQYLCAEITPEHHIDRLAG
jgi:hypothetical protein